MSAIDNSISCQRKAYRTNGHTKCQAQAHTLLHKHSLSNTHNVSQRTVKYTHTVNAHTWTLSVHTLTLIDVILEHKHVLSTHTQMNKPLSNTNKDCKHTFCQTHTLTPSMHTKIDAQSSSLILGRYHSALQQCIIAKVHCNSAVQLLSNSSGSHNYSRQLHTWTLRLLAPCFCSRLRADLRASRACLNLPSA